MNGDEQNAGIVGKDPLRAVAVMDVEIEDRDASEPWVRPQGVPSANRHVVEQAEALARRMQGHATHAGVMAWWARGDKGVAARATHHVVDRPHTAPDAERGGNDSAERNVSRSCRRGLTLAVRRRMWRQSERASTRAVTDERGVAGGEGAAGVLDLSRAASLAVSAPCEAAAVARGVRIRCAEPHRRLPALWQRPLEKCNVVGRMHERRDEFGRDLGSGGDEGEERRVRRRQLEHIHHRAKPSRLLRAARGGQWRMQTVCHTATVRAGRAGGAESTYRAARQEEQRQRRAALPVSGRAAPAGAGSAGGALS